MVWRKGSEGIALWIFDWPDLASSESDLSSNRAHLGQPKNSTVNEYENGIRGL